MDQTLRSLAQNSIVVTGYGCEVNPALWEHLIGSSDKVAGTDLVHDCKPIDYLKVRKNLKLMSKQDRMAVSAAGKALHMSKIADENLGLDCGVFISVGYIPFEQKEITLICENSMEDNQFSMSKFSDNAFNRINPNLIFQCLPNMCAHHITVNFNLMGEYMITYPDTVQFYAALNEAVWALIEDRAPFVLVGGVADQNNFLVENHFCKENSGRLTRVADSGAFFVLEKEAYAQSRSIEPLIRLTHLSCASNTATQDSKKNDIQFGPVELPMRLAAFLSMRPNTGARIFDHVCQNQDVTVQSKWELI